MYIVYIGSDKIRIVDAKVSGGKIKVLSLFNALTPNDYLDRPNDKSFTEIASIIAQGFREIDSKTKNVKVILENGTIPFTDKVLPTLPDAKVSSLIKNEIFSDEKLAMNNVVDYVEVERFVDEVPLDKKRVLGKKDESSSSLISDEKQDSIDNEKIKTKKIKMSKIFFTYVEKEIITHIEKLFKDLNLSLKSIDIYQNCMFRMINTLQKFSKKSDDAQDFSKTFILFEYKEDAVTIFLFIDGNLAYCFRKSLMASMADKSFFLSEITQAISEAIGFFRSKYEEIEFDYIYATGILDNFDFWKADIESRIKYEINALKTPMNIYEVDDIEFNEYSGALAGYFKGDK